MEDVLVVAERGGGASTFLGLLYWTLVHPADPTAPRFHVPRTTLRPLAEAYASLARGEFPRASTAGEDEGLDVELASAGPLRWPRSARRELALHLVRADELVELAQHAPRTDPLLARRLSSRRVLLLLDATHRPDAGRRPGSWAYDAQLREGLSWVSRFGASAHGRAARIEVSLVWTKSDPPARPIPRPPPPPPRSPSERRASAALVLERWLPRTGDLLRRGPPGGGLRFGRPDLYTCWVRPQRPGPDAGVERSRTADGLSVELHYSHAEFSALWRRLGGGRASP